VERSFLPPVRPAAGAERLEALVEPAQVVADRLAQPGIGHLCVDHLGHLCMSTSAE
jgi:hypothetical protein